MHENDPFGDLVEVYESLVDWPRRLAHEQDFYRHQFETATVRRVVDVACGTGHHAAMFHRWGLTVQAADASAEMIRHARQQYNESETLEWFVRSYDQPIRADSPFDAAICVGNSLALAATDEMADQAIGQMLAAVRPGGVVIVQTLNLWRLPDGPCCWQKCRRLAGPRGELSVVKGVHRCGKTGFVDVVIIALDGEPVMRSESVGLLGLDADRLESAAGRAGASRIEFFGGYQGEQYDRNTSVDLVMVCRRGDTPP
jgi:SAM-dependent methyltransferase